MSIEVVWHKDAVDFLRKLDDVNRLRIVKKMRDIRLNPERYVFSLVNMELSKIRVGDYRVFVNYYKDESKLIIHTIKHRRNAYKK